MFERSTPNLGLPQWSPKDHPDFLTDMNNAFKVLDERVHAEDESSNAIAQLVEKVNKLTEDLTAVTADVEVLKDTFDADEIEQMKGDINTLTEDVANITTAVQNHTASITEITSHLSVIDSDIATIKSTIADHTSRISNNETMVTNLNTALSALDGTVNNISTLLSTVETNLQTAQSDIDELDTRIIATNAAVSSLQTDVTQASNNAQTALNTANSAHVDAEGALNMSNKLNELLRFSPRYALIYKIISVKSSKTGEELESPLKNTEILLNVYANIINVAVVFRKYIRSTGSVVNLDVPASTAIYLEYVEPHPSASEEDIVKVENKVGFWIYGTAGISSDGYSLGSSISLYYQADTTKFSRNNHIYIVNPGNSDSDLLASAQRKTILFQFSRIEEGDV